MQFCVIVRPPLPAPVMGVAGSAGRGAGGSLPRTAHISFDRSRMLEMRQKDPGEGKPHAGIRAGFDRGTDRPAAMVHPEDKLISSFGFKITQSPLGKPAGNLQGNINK